MKQKKSHDVQLGQVQSPALRLEQSHAPGQAGTDWLGSSSAEEDLGVTPDNKPNIASSVPLSLRRLTASWVVL